MQTLGFIVFVNLQDCALVCWLCFCVTVDSLALITLPDMTWARFSSALSAEELGLIGRVYLQTKADA